MDGLVSELRAVAKRTSKEGDLDGRALTVPELDRGSAAMTDTSTNDDAAVESYISDEMRAALGGLLVRRVSFPVSESDIRRWALAVYYPDAPPPRFVDAAAATGSRAGAITAPEDFNPFAWMAAETQSGQVPSRDANHVELSLGITPPPLRFQLNGGIEADYGVPIRPGDVITSENRLAAYSERSGRLGLMLFTVVEETWTNQRGELVKRQRKTQIRY